MSQTIGRASVFISPPPYSAVVSVFRILSYTQEQLTELVDGVAQLTNKLIKAGVTTANQGGRDSKLRCLVKHPLADSTQCE